MRGDRARDPGLAGVRALLLTGPVGVGKTAIAIEVGTQLAREGRHPAVLDLDWLAWLENRVGLSAEDLILRNLRAVWPNFLAAGADSAVVARMVVGNEFQERVAAVLGASVTVVRLTASAEVLRQRVMRRDAGAELAEHLEMIAGGRGRPTEGGRVIDTSGRTIAEVAAEVRCAASL